MLASETIWNVIPNATSALPGVILGKFEVGRKVPPKKMAGRGLSAS